MSWNQEDLDRIKAAIASGELSIQFADGRKVEFRSIGDLFTAKRAVQAEVNGSSSTPGGSAGYHLADFS